MATNIASAIDKTHTFLHKMGAKVAPDKSFNFSNCINTAKWLAETIWDGISAKIDVVKDFRYLGAHITTKSNCRSKMGRPSAG